MTFAEELNAVLPADLPHRDACIAGAARHLDLIVEANRLFNLTRIVDPREAAIKHVLDSVTPWRFFEGAGHIIDAGSGAGFPGIPLALVLPGSRFTLLESTQKKARFIESAAKDLELANLEVRAERAEEWLKGHRVPLITARAVAPLDRAIALFGPAIRSGARALLYKGPDAEQEIADAASEAAKRKVRLRVLHRYDLPESMGTRTLIEIVAAK